jgi:hypothetical protein
MKDPWRVTTADDKKRAAAPAQDKARKINLDEKDLDADIRPKRTCPIRFKRCTFEICSSQIQTQDDAIQLLVECVTALRTVGLGPALDVERIGSGPADKRPQGCSSVGGARGAVWFLGRTLDDGTMALARLLATASQHPQGSQVLRKYGVRAMIRA